jgi:hypothetical protein
MDQKELRTITQMVGANMRRTREERAKVLHDVASAAREMGLTWDASAVSRIETGKRDLSLEEFLALPLIMTLALNETVTMVDLMMSGEADELLYLKNFNREIGIIDVLPMLAEPFVVMGEHDMQLEGGTLSEVVRHFLDRDKRKIQKQRQPAEDPDSLRELRDLADELGARPGEVMDAIKTLWGEYSITLSSVRERKLLESGEDLSNPNRVRTLRGHLTRQLTAELRGYFATRKHSDRPTGGD